MVSKEIQRHNGESRIDICLRNLGRIIVEASGNAGLPESSRGEGFDGESLTWQWSTSVDTKGGEAISTTILTVRPDTLEQDILEIRIGASAYLQERRDLAWGGTYFSERLNSAVLKRRGRHTRKIEKKIEEGLEQAWNGSIAIVQLLPKLEKNNQLLIAGLRAQGLLYDKP